LGGIECAADGLADGLGAVAYSRDGVTYNGGDWTVAGRFLFFILWRVVFAERDSGNVRRNFSFRSYSS
jgi:hypothetical protein